MSGCALDPAHPNEGSIWVFADITERKQAEEKLRLSATVLEHIADGVMVVDVDGRIVAVNPAFTQITGYTEAEALGQPSSLTRSGAPRRGASTRPCGASCSEAASGAARCGTCARTASCTWSG